LSPLPPSSLPAAPAAPRWYRSALIKAFGAMPRGHLRLELPDGGALEFGSADDAANRRLALGLSPRAHLKVHREAFFAKCFWSGDIGFAEAYIDGDWETPDLTALIAFFIRNVETRRRSPARGARAWPALNLLRFANRVGHLLRHNTRTIARRNIARALRPLQRLLRALAGSRR
jgi:cyclopropane-fatty-acyl-phospholipid synthase